MTLVLDRSATLAWIYAEETTNAVRDLFDIVAEEGAVVPAIWRFEVVNSLTVAARRGRIDVEFRNAALADLALLDITTDPQTDAYSLDNDRHSRRRVPPDALRCGLFGARPSAARCPSPPWTRNCALPAEPSVFRCLAPRHKNEHRWRLTSTLPDIEKVASQ